MKNDRPGLYYFGALGRFGAFDNLFPCRFKLDGCIWRSAEHYYQAQKQQPHRTYVECVRKAFDGMGAKRLGYTVAPVDKKRWDSVKFAVMQRATHAKFTQNPRLRKLLLQTGFTPLLEDNPHDYTWGCGADRSGSNWCGEVLMQVRRNLQRRVRQCPCESAPSTKTK